MNNVNKIIYVLLLLGTTQLCFAMLPEQAQAASLAALLHGSGRVKLPMAQTIRRRLADLKLDHFYDNSQIGTLAGQEKYPNEVSIGVDMNLNRYRQEVPEAVAQLAQSQRNNIIRAILADHPLAIQSLEKSGLLE